MAAHEASSSSSSGWSYEVFLSFHGKDIRTSFADHFYIALVDAGIRSTFRDEEELQKGNKIWPELCTAIQQSRISIPIFSENYASSKWCLDELTVMAKCKRRMDQIVLPIFYRVEPRDVRHQTGSYKKVFEEHQTRFDEKTLRKWQKALRKVGKLKGWHLQKDTYEGKLIKEIVKKVWCKLNKTPLILPNNLVGIESRIRKMLMLLDIESGNRKIVGIHGIGGIGKTTIARAVYNKVFHHFEGYSFIENIQKNAKKHGLSYLQNQLIKDILNQEKQNITSLHDGIDVIQRRFCQKKVFFVLDDVDQDNQVKYLVGDHERFANGSKIIITCRNKDILRGADGFYEPEVMDLDDSLQLFSHHAFKRDQPLKHYMRLSKAIVETTRGLPLAIEVTGSSLFLKKKSVWKGTLKQLRKVPDEDVLKRLEISYDGLKNEEVKQMFLDTACFFIGMKKDIACHIWDRCGFSPKVGLDALCVRSLVMISEGELRMHDHLRDLGRQIVRRESIDEPGKRTRICTQKEVLKVLSRQTGTTSVKGLSIDFKYKFMNRCLMSEGFEAMTKLRFLQVDYAYFPGNITNSFSELRWLSWKGCPDLYMLTNFCPQKLAVLDLSCSDITKNWKGWNCIKMAVKLKVLVLSSCHQLSRTPDLSANRHLKVLLLNHCGTLFEIDTSIGSLKNLDILDMSHCDRLVELPNEICQLTSLRRLDLKVCTSLERLPEKLGCMISLTTLDLSYCRSLVDLPIEICQLTSLETLHLNSCSSLKKLPEKLDCIISSTTLDLSYCESLVDLPVEICQLTSLETLVLSGCKSLVHLPVEIWQLTSLKTLDLSGCKSLEDLPNEICQLNSLQRLNLWGCKKLLRISNLPSSLTSLDVRECVSVQYFSGLPSNLTLETLDLTRWEGLSCFPIEICQLTSLQRLHLWRCTKLLHISDFPPHLTNLVIEFCSSMQYISGLPSSLISLYAKDCKSIKKLSCTSGLRNLETLELDECNSLEEIEGVDEGLESLVLFRVLGKSLKKLPNLSNSKRLGELVIYHCPQLSNIEGLEDCESLETLTICYSMGRRLPDLSNLNKLLVLTIECCGELTEIPGLDRLESLRNLTIGRCEALRLPDLSNFKNLNDLTQY